MSLKLLETICLVDAFILVHGQNPVFLIHALESLKNLTANLFVSLSLCVSRVIV